MDYEQKYKEALNLAKSYYENHEGGANQFLDTIFPELRESDDEKISREISEFLVNYNNGEYKRPNENTIDSWLSWLEKQGEQKPVDNLEPKFKVGDWVVNNDVNVYQIKEINYTNIIPRYELENIDGDKLSIPFTSDYNLRNWTINDANDGDVLASHECYVIFKEIDGLNIKCYCTYHYLGLNPSLYIDTLQNKTAFYPAIKEQRDILYQKMHEAGYTWDANTKQLIKNK